MFVIFSDVPYSLAGHKGDYPIYNTDNLTVKKISYTDLVQQIGAEGLSAFSNNVTDDGNGNYSVEYRINVEGISINALGWEVDTTKQPQVKYNSDEVSLAIDNELNLVLNINGQQHTLAHKPQANGEYEGLNLHWDNKNQWVEKELKEYDKAQCLDFDYVEAISGDRIVKFLLHYEDNRFIVALDELGNPLGLFCQEYNFDEVNICDEALSGEVGGHSIMQIEGWWGNLRLQIP